MRPIETPVSARRVSGREGPVVHFVNRTRTFSGQTMDSSDTKGAKRWT